MASQSYTGNPPAIPGKPIIKDWPTPSDADRIYVCRRDTRAAGYVEPDRGAAFTGVNAEKYTGFIYICQVPCDQVGWVDEYYLNERLNQEEYNGELSYPYTDKNYPQLTRTYVFLRGDQRADEPQADSADPVETDLKLVDHKIFRLQDKILDAMFVGVQRVYEKLPSPVITSYEVDNYQQVVTRTTQEVETASIPVPTALTAEQSVQRKTTAKALVTTGVVPQVPSRQVYAIRRDIYEGLPIEFRVGLPEYIEAHTEAGTAAVPVLGAGETSQTQTQETDKRVRIETKSIGDLGDLPMTLVSYALTDKFGGTVLQIVKTLADTVLGVSSGLMVLESEVRNMGNGIYLRITQMAYTDTEWPLLTEYETDPRTGVTVTILKRVVTPVGATGGIDPTYGYVDIKSIDKWRSLWIATKLDPSSLPDPVTWETTATYDFPNTLTAVSWIWAYASTSDNYSFDATLITTIKQGYSGPCRAKITETFSNGAPGTAVSVTTFFPQGHMVGFAWWYANDDVNIAKTGAGTFSISPTLHPAMTIGGGLVLGSGGFSNTLPATTPTAVPASGTLITKAVDVERWRFGVFYRRLTQIYVP